MVPTSLTLENFLSYRERQTLDFSGLELACLSGKNGHGKSALLDAITWALWGEARKEGGKGKPDAGLLNVQAKQSEGPTEMDVVLDFTSGESSYQVARSYRESATGKTTRGDVKLFSLDGDRTDLTARSMRKTQSLIDEAVGTKHDTFVNTAFVIQGESDEFTKKTPSKRKEVLANVLRLGRFDELREETRRRRSDIEERLNRLEGRISSLKQDLKGAADRKRSLQAKKQQAAEAKATQRRAEEKLEAARQKVEESRDAADRIQQLEDDYDEITKEIASLRDESNRLDREQEDIEDLLRREEKIRTRYQRYQDLQDRRAGLEDARSEHRACKKQIQKLRDQIEEADRQLQNYAEDLETTREQTWKRLCDIHGEEPEAPGDVPESINDKIEQQWRKGHKLKQLETKIENLEAEADELKDKKNEAQRQIAVKKSRIDEEDSFLADLEELEGADCPRCGQRLTERHVDEQFDETNDRIEQLQEEIDELEEEEDRLFGEIDALLDERDEAVEKAQTLRAQMQPQEKLKETLEKAKSLEKKHLETEQKLQNLRAHDNPHSLVGVENYDDLHDQVEKHENRMEEIGFDPSEINEIQRELRELRGIEDEKTQLERALDKRESAEKRQQEIENERESLQARLDEIDEQIEDLKPTVNKLGAREQTLDRLQKRANACEEKHDQFVAAVGRLKGRVASDEDKQKELTEAKETRSTWEEEKTRLTHLRDAFGKHGIPSLIIEDAIPQLEERANALLDRLTDGMGIRLETTREKQSGGTTDTLDVIIESASGAARPYETYSGGESFRVDFALRVALSQLLARRSGAPLKTLVIDEGFGTQDDDGLVAMQEAIAEIADDFELVLVITHLDELKNAFPQRIEVRKTPGRGSTFTVYK